MVSVIIIVVHQVVARKRKCERVKRVERVERIITPVVAVPDNERNTVHHYITVLNYAHAINNIIIIVGFT